MRIILFTIFFLFSARLLSQEEEDSTSFVAIKTHLVRSKMEKTDFFGISRNVKRLEVVAKTKVQTSCNGGVYGTWDTVSNVLYIYQTIDSIGNLRDSIYNRLKAYFHERLKNSKIPGDSNIFYNYPHGFYSTSAGYIPFISSDNESEGSWTILYFKGKLYKIELFVGYGFGCLSSFIEQNFYLETNGHLVKLERKLMWNSTARGLLGL